MVDQNNSINVVHSIIPAFASSIVLKLLMLSAILLILKILWSRRKLYALSMNLPGPFAYPIIGNVLDIGMLSNYRDSINSVRKLKQIYGEIFRIWLGVELSVVISEPQDVECILLSKATSSKGPKYKLLTQAIGEGLLTVSGEKWKRHRHLINPSFNGISCKSYQKIHDKHGRHMANGLLKLCGIGLVDVKIHSLRCTADMIIEGLFGQEEDFYKGDKDNFIKKIPIIAELLYERMCKIWLQYDSFYKFTESGKKMNKNMAEYRSFFTMNLSKKYDKRLNDNMRSRNNNENDVGNKLSRNTFDIMMDEVIEGKFTKQEVIDEFDNIFCPGLDTTYTHLNFFILMMAINRKCQDLLWQEIREVFSEDLDAPVTSEVLSKMKYLEMCWKEVTRLFPTGPIQMRLLKQDFYMKHRDLIIPAGTSLLISNFILHRDSKYWDDPDQYKPERFSDENKKNRPHFAYIPFSSGLRNCIGQIFGYDMLKTASIHLIRNMEFHSDIKMENVNVIADISTRSVHGYKVHIKKRNY